MSGFENYIQEIGDIEREIVRKGIALGIDWDNEIQVRALAREALQARPCPESCAEYMEGGDWRTRFDLFGLVQLMLTVMRESAKEDMLAHGGSVWKTFGHALWLEAELLDLIEPDKPASGNH